MGGLLLRHMASPGALSVSSSGFWESEETQNWALDGLAGPVSDLVAREEAAAGSAGL